MRKMFYYVCGPIDSFCGMRSLSGYIAQPDPDNNYDEGINYLGGTVEELMKAAKVFGNSWDGDIRQGVFVFSVPVHPDETDMKVGYLWKHDNNGVTFIVSPIKLAAFSEYEVGGAE